jgi:hypothetical protein
MISLFSHPITLWRTTDRRILSVEGCNSISSLLQLPYSAVCHFIRFPFSWPAFAHVTSNYSIAFSSCFFLTHNCLVYLYTVLSFFDSITAIQLHFIVLSYYEYLSVGSEVLLQSLRTGYVGCECEQIFRCHDAARLRNFCLYIH